MKLGILDMLRSEKGTVALVVLVGVFVAFFAGLIPLETWESMVTWITTAYIGGKAVDSVATRLANGKKPAAHDSPR